ncbi:acyltransferase family protein [Myxacorys almedinensis]|uniref:Acyltransferase family protein n=1 Tax=Myxacorys almedinensis A TaxID=2690445 RepID=A0A8J7Z221_9CYAN|nr:acyltransferase family protein [Myxacorys almedinensis]NDJ17815.1 acyltransferase family protein [Myxacorys almedinensis A]
MPSSEDTQQLTQSRQRRYDIDWLRVLAVLLLLYFHTAAVFYQGDLGEFYIRNARSSQVMNSIVLFIHQWHMPLFFLISGAGTWFALSYRSTQQYVQERCQRLFIPFVFGTLVLIPPQVYLRLLSDSTYDQSYWQFYPKFFNGIRPHGNFEWGHLWFLIYLFTFSLVALPLLLHLRRLDAPLRLTLTNWIEKPGVVLLMAFPLAAIESLLRPRWAGFQNLYDDWANLCLYVLYFFYGYLMCSDARFGTAIDKHLGTALGLALVCMGLLLSLWQSDRIPDRAYSLVYMAYQGFRGCNSWFWVLALLGLGRRFLNFNSKLLSYANEAAYPVYLLHQTVLVAIAFYVVRWNSGIATKFWIISTASLIVTIGLYELLIRRFNIPRFLFGLKPIVQQPSQPTVASQERSS